MKIYTKTGDGGQTGLFGGPRVDKDHVRIEAYGTVDELNAALGQARCEPLPTDIDQLLTTIQHDLFAIGAELATPNPDQHGTKMIGASEITKLEQCIDRYDDRLPPLTQFILPAGHRGATSLHLARSICRRAERRIVSLRKTAQGGVSDEVLTYLNRLGDLLFVLSRAVNQAAQVTDTAWQKQT